eukprot:TRINITY_DN24424_c0_g1_i1.p1 TRINITY_DN24424_c0_g1~~TRINITY_DN24424_c0_g1_i1.p1  ORF type:complete len:104 (+),score=19.68 TRINITY_DN24424_c0_g1_i1:26-337(+)
MVFFFSSRRRHTRSCLVSWARRCVQETVSTQSTWGDLSQITNFRAKNYITILQSNLVKSNLEPLQQVYQLNLYHSQSFNNLNKNICDFPQFIFILSNFLHILI